MKEKISRGQILGAFILLFLIPFFISYSQEITLEKLIKDSEVIVIGNVKKIESKLELEKNIWTYVTIECKYYLKGNKKNELTVRIPGGVVGNLGQNVSGTPKYEVGEEVLNFLGKDTNGFYYVNGWEKGKFTYKRGNWIQNNSIQPETFIDTIKSILDLR